MAGQSGRGRENLETQHHVTWGVPTGGRNHEKVLSPSPGGHVCSVHRAGALLHHHRVHVQRCPARLPTKRWRRRGKASIWQPYIHCSSGEFWLKTLDLSLATFYIKKNRWPMAWLTWRGKGWFTGTWLPEMFWLGRISLLRSPSFLNLSRKGTVLWS